MPTVPIAGEDAQKSELSYAAGRNEKLCRYSEKQQGSVLKA